MSAAECISHFNLADFRQNLADSYSNADVVVVVTPTFKMKVAYTFPANATLTVASATTAIAAANDVSQSDVSVAISSSRLRRLGESRRLQSTVDAEIATVNQSALAALQTSMEQPLTIGGVAATASTNATVDVELVTTVTQPGTVTADLPTTTEIGGFLPSTITAEVLVSEAFDQTFTTAPCASYTCSPGTRARSNAASLACASATCAPSDNSQCCENVPGSGSAGGAVAISAHPFVTTLVVFASSILFC